MAKSDQAIGRQVSRFAMVGALNTIAGVAVIFILYKGFDFSLIMSNAVGYGVGLIVSFVLNGSWTFGVSSYRPLTVAKYAALVCFAFIMNIFLIQLLMSFNIAYWIAQMVGVATYSALVFLGMKYAIFTK
jgi:putative flippase GtrA